jgi:predicted KAP-like P-loop ATPase
MGKLKDAFKIKVDEELKKVNQLVEHNINESANRVIQGIDRNVKVTAELDYDRGAL